LFAPVSFAQATFSLLLRSYIHYSCCHLINDKSFYMKKVLLPLLIAIVYFSCVKDPSTGLPYDKKGTGKKVDVCHREGNGSFHTINISSNAVPAHLAHGDVIPDADGDGYTKVNPCGIGAQNDCNDDNPAIHPGAKEICDNGVDDNCNGKIDEECIKFVTICNQAWMARNLEVKSFRDGTPIPQVTDVAEWTNTTKPAWCYYANVTANGITYGVLYNWFAVNGDIDGDGDKDKELAPTGWHVASDAEWKTLSDCLGGAAIAGGPLKEAGGAHWTAPNAGATNSSGFTALPGGFRNNAGSFESIGFKGYWWTATESSSTNAVYRFLDYNTVILTAANDDKNHGFSVRCVRN
jgi:uncharacterized protein (TIGR02145 family)